MFRINSQSAPQPAQAATTGGAAKPAPNSLEGLLASLEEAIQRLTQMQGGQHAGGGDRMEPAPHQPPAHQAQHHHHHRHQHQQPPVAKPPVVQPQPPVAKPPVMQPQPPVAKPPVIRLPPVVQPPIIRFPPIVVGGPTGGPIGGPIGKLPEGPGGVGQPQAMGDSSGGIIRKGLAGGTVGT